MWRMRSNFAEGHVGALNGQTADLQYFLQAFLRESLFEQDLKQSGGFFNTETLYLDITIKLVLKIQLTQVKVKEIF